MLDPHTLSLLLLKDSKSQTKQPLIKSQRKPRRLPKFWGRTALLILILIQASSVSVFAQGGVLGGSINKVGTLDLKEFVDLGDGKLNDLNYAPGDDKIYVVKTDPGIFSVAADGSSFSTFLDVNAAVLGSTGRSVSHQSRVHFGTRSVAFHPDYQSNGKFYTSIIEGSNQNGAGPLLGSSLSRASGESVLVEWTANPTTGVADPDSYREVFRVGFNDNDHPIKRIRFNEYAQPGDEDYGLLYVAHGDGTKASNFGNGQNGDDALGKLLRIDPIDPDGPGGAAYSVPATNPFVGDATKLDEIYALGFRNPHNFDWHLDSNGDDHLLLADIGHNALEEINLVEAGKNYGWNELEGTRVYTGGGNGDPLGAGSIDTAGFTFPVAQFGRVDGTIAVFGGYVVPAGENQGEYVFGNFSSTRLFHVTLDELITQVTEGDSEDLTQLAIEEFASVTLEGAPTTFSSLVENSRSDARMGRGPDGTIYITTKSNGKIWAILPAVPEPTSMAIALVGLLGVSALRRRNVR